MPLWRIGLRFEVINLEDGKQFQWWAGAAEIGVKFESCVISSAPNPPWSHKEIKFTPAVIQPDTSWESPAVEQPLLETFIQSSLSTYSSIYDRSPPTHLWGSRCLNPIYKNDNSRKLFPDCNPWERRKSNLWQLLYTLSVPAEHLKAELCSSESVSRVWSSQSVTVVHNQEGVSLPASASRPLSSL